MGQPSDASIGSKSKAARTRGHCRRWTRKRQDYDLGWHCGSLCFLGVFQFFSLRPTVPQAKALANAVTKVLHYMTQRARSDDYSDLNIVKLFPGEMDLEQVDSDPGEFSERIDDADTVIALPYAICSEALVYFLVVRKGNFWSCMTTLTNSLNRRSGQRSSAFPRKRIAEDQSCRPT